MSQQIAVFVSYARNDNPVILPFVEFLRAVTPYGRTTVFFDLDSIDVGESFPDRIREAIESCDRFMLFWSHNAMQSKWVNQELDIALQNRKVILPILLDATDLRSDIATIQSLDLSRAAAAIQADGEMGLPLTKCFSMPSDLQAVYGDAESFIDEMVGPLFDWVYGERVRSMEILRNLDISM